MSNLNNFRRLDVYMEVIVNMEEEEEVDHDGLKRHFIPPSPTGLDSWFSATFPEVSFREVDENEFTSWHQQVPSRLDDNLTLILDDNLIREASVLLLDENEDPSLRNIDDDGLQQSKTIVDLQAPPSPIHLTGEEANSSASAAATSSSTRTDSEESIKLTLPETKTILPVNFVPGSWSVMIGKDKKCLNCPGNKRLHSVVAEYLDRYGSCGKKRHVKSEIITEIVNKFLDGHGRNMPGSFIKYKNGRYFEVTTEMAREKIGRMLRESLHTKYTSSSKQKRLRHAKASKQEALKKEDKATPTTTKSY